MSSIFFFLSLSTLPLSAIIRLVLLLTRLWKQKTKKKSPGEFFFHKYPMMIMNTPHTHTWNFYIRLTLMIKFESFLKNFEKKESVSQISSSSSYWWYNIFEYIYWQWWLWWSLPIIYNKLVLNLFFLMMMMMMLQILENSFKIYLSSNTIYVLFELLYMCVFVSVLSSSTIIINDIGHGEFLLLLVAIG